MTKFCLAGCYFFDEHLCRAPSTPNAQPFLDKTAPKRPCYPLQNVSSASTLSSKLNPFSQKCPRKVSMWTYLGSLDVHDKKFVQLVYISTLVVASKLSSNAVGEFSGEPRRIKRTILSCRSIELTQVVTTSNVVK